MTEAVTLTGFLLVTIPEVAILSFLAGAYVALRLVNREMARREHDP